MEIRKNFLDFACRWEMRLMWRAFLYRGRGNGKRLDLIGFRCLASEACKSDGGVTVECVALLASPGPPPGGSSTAVVGQNCWLGAWWGWQTPLDGGHLMSSHYGWTLVTDGRVDDRLVWWSGCSKLSAWSPVRVSQAVISVLLAGRRVVTEDVQLEVI